MGEASWALDLVRTVGVPVAVLAVFSWAIWKILIWVGTEVVIPVRDKLISKAVAVMDQMSVTLATMSASLERITEQLERVEELSKRFECRVTEPRSPADLMTAAHTGIQREKP